MTCRGSRFADGAKRNPDGQVFMKNRETDEWLAQNQRSTKNFIRKWGHFVKHDEYLKPIIPHKYNIGFIVKNSHDIQLIGALEPWCSDIFVDIPSEKIKNYIDLEQPNTMFDLNNRIHSILAEPENDILVEIDGTKFAQEDMQYISQLPEILDDSTFLEEDMGEQFEVGNLKLTINDVKTYEKDLIICKE